jgi:putative ABC transport system permease protein
MVNIPSTIKISLRALSANKMRSGLTMLGVIIGVGAVITMLAVGQGASRRISEQIASMGSNMLLVHSGASTAGGVRMGHGARPTLNLADAEAIAKECSAVAYVAPEHSGISQVVHGNQNWPSGIRGTTSGFLNIRDWPLSGGRAFTDQEVRSASKVAILGRTVAENLFGDVNPVGKTMRIKKMPFKVIGVLVKKGQSSRGRDQDEIVLVPITTAQKKLFKVSFPGTVNHIFLKVKSFEDLSIAENQVTELLRQRHRIGPGQEDDFTVRNITERMQAYEESSRVMALLLGAIASVSLLVGGIGIMNIMLVSVTERTREIGIRTAVGAKTWDIRTQFLIEALTLSLIGGIIGIILGISASKALSIIMGWSTIISPALVLLAFSFSALVGLFFGFYPAYKASLLNPIDALRHE